MAKKYHLKVDGTPAPCDADKRPCPKGDVPHFNTPDEARAHYERLNNAGFIPASLSKKYFKNKSHQQSKEALREIRRNESPLKKFTKVAGGVLVAVLAINGISNISNENSNANAVPDEVPDSSISTVEEVPEVVALPDIDDSYNDDSSNSTSYSDTTDYVKEGKELFNKGKDAIAGGVGAAANWVSNNETIQNGIADTKDWVNNNETIQNGISTAKDWWSGITNGTSDYETILTVDNDGSVKWGDKSLTPTAEEVNNAKNTLNKLNVAPKNTVSNYDREGIFGKQGDEIRGKIEHRDLDGATFNNRDRATSGTLKDPYTGKTLTFNEGESRPYDLEHIVALKEVERSENKAHPLTAEQKQKIANDPNNLILVDSSANRSKGDKNANEWIPSYEPAQCRFAIETISVKNDYKLNVDKGEKQVLENILNTRCEVK